MEKKRVRITVAYDGTNYHGWQLQDNGITVEAELNRCLTELLGEEIKVIGASRTDSGVHALGNVAVFDTVNRPPAGRGGCACGIGYRSPNWRKRRASPYSSLTK